ncbi:MAG: hypothetical protein PHQ93_07970 [Sulfurimonas sp.]|uniref:hypothetical protein n=1 Tax=Sulfurimonas sp. TaxID=2022749 RepID=UPI00262F54D7|nr:hypothetical protein [Sulfurimonas sp.]MDD5401106.1 hypothetical protein [Sulfurimonas sp.]
MSKIPDMKKDKNKTSDFSLVYADVLKGIGINEAIYYQRILDFMSLLTINSSHLNSIIITMYNPRDK